MQHREKPTAREESILREDGDGIDEEDRHYCDF